MAHDVLTVTVQPVGGSTFEITLNNKPATVAQLKAAIKEHKGTTMASQMLFMLTSDGAGSSGSDAVSEGAPLSDGFEIRDSCTMVLTLSDCSEIDTLLELRDSMSGTEHIGGWNQLNRNMPVSEAAALDLYYVVFSDDDNHVVGLNLFYLSQTRGMGYCRLQNDLADLDLSGLERLQTLSCHELQLTKLPSLLGLVNLQVLKCCKNELTELPDLSSLRSLRELHCYNNQLTKLPVLHGLVSLRILYCFNNKLTELPNLTPLVNLRQLNCSHNKLTELPNLSR